MSTIAIKSFFESSKRRKITPETPNKRVCQEEPVSIPNEERMKYSFETIKNWEGSQNHLISFYNNLDEEQYQYVLANREQLSFETMAILWPDEFNPPLSRNLKLKVRDITEEGYRRILLDKMKIREKIIDERIATIATLPMPKSHLETTSINLKKILETKEKQLEDVKKSIDTGKYVTPSKRISVVESNPAVVSLVKVIQEIKNEIEKTDQRLKVLKDEWERNEKFRLRHKIEQELAMSGM